MTERAFFKHDPGPYELATLVAISIEFILYGIYVSLFSASLYIMSERQKTLRFQEKIFFPVSILMFLVATVDIGLNFYRVLEGYVKTQRPATYFENHGLWPNITHNIFAFIMMSLGNSLAVYRCFTLWGNNLSVVLLPAFLFIPAFVDNVVVLRLSYARGTVPKSTLRHLRRALYPLTFLPNFLTTGLIMFKLWKQNHSNALHVAGRRTLGMRIMRYIKIAMESALFYTLSLLTLTILNVLSCDGQYVLRYSLVPIIGIVFNILTVRVHLTQRRPPRTVTIVEGSSRRSMEESHVDDSLTSGIFNRPLEKD